MRVRQKAAGSGPDDGACRAPWHTACGRRGVNRCAIRMSSSGVGRSATEADIKKGVPAPGQSPPSRPQPPTIRRRATPSPRSTTPTRSWAMPTSARSFERRRDRRGGQAPLHRLRGLRRRWSARRRGRGRIREFPLRLRPGWWRLPFLPVAVLAGSMPPTSSPTCSRGGRGGPRKARGGADVKIEATITLAEAVKGTSLRVTLPSGRDVEVKIPAGIAEGQTVRLKGQGHPSPVPGGPPGDVLGERSRAPRSPFRGRRQRHPPAPSPSASTRPCSGAKVRAPTLEGAVELTIPPNSSSGRTLRLRGKGLPSGDARGDLLVTLEIVLPPQARRRVEGADGALERDARLRPAQGFLTGPSERFCVLRHGLLRGLVRLSKIVVFQRQRSSS